MTPTFKTGCAATAANGTRTRPRTKLTSDVRIDRFSLLNSLCPLRRPGEELCPAGALGLAVEGVGQLRTVGVHPDRDVQHLTVRQPVMLLVVRRGIGSRSRSGLLDGEQKGRQSRRRGQPQVLGEAPFLVESPGVLLPAGDRIRSERRNSLAGESRGRGQAPLAERTFSASSSPSCRARNMRCCCGSRLGKSFW